MDELKNITVRKATEQDCVELQKLNYSGTSTRMFSLAMDGTTLSLKEVELPDPVVIESEHYKGITEEVLPNINNPEYIALVVCSGDKPLGWVLASWKQRKMTKVMVVWGILVASEARGKGCADALIDELIKIAKKEPGCDGIRVEMDTTKYSACKLLLRKDFKFAGTELYVWHSGPPTQFSKEVLYFFYQL